MKISFHQFFDRPAVIAAVDKAAKKTLSIFGALTRRAARASIKKRKAISAAGEPPSSHVGTLKRLIFFGYEPQTKTVTIGPTPLYEGGQSKRAPELLEYGGTVSRPVKKAQALRHSDGGYTRAVADGQISMTYRPRPFMGPAFERTLRDSPNLWRDAVKR